MKNSFIIIFLILMVVPTLGQTKINWQKTTDALVNAEVQKKFVLLYVKTEWCAFCRKLANEVFADKEVAEYVDKNFIPARIDAESKTEIVKYQDKFFTAGEYTKSVGVKSYPTIIFLNEKGKLVANLNGYYPKKDVVKALKFIINGQIKNAE